MSRIPLRRAVLFLGDALVDYSTWSPTAGLLWLRVRSLLAGAGMRVRAAGTTARGGRLYRIDDYDEHRSRWFSSLRQGMFYTAGFDRRAAELGQSYGLEHVPFVAGDVVIDCGANYGDLHMYLESVCAGRGVQYIAFEPGPDELECLTRNIGHSRQARIEAMALSNTVGTMPLFYDPTPANSSLVEPDNWAERVDVQVSTLDQFVEAHLDSGQRIRLLKLEAEGAEPEVVQGALQVLDRIDFIAADLGFERGKLAASTAPAVVNLLLANGFELYAVGSTASIRLLFRNRAVDSAHADQQFGDHE